PAAYPYSVSDANRRGPRPRITRYDEFVDISVHDVGVPRYGTPGSDLNVVKTGQGGAVVNVSSRPDLQVSTVVDEHADAPEYLHGSLNRKVRILSYVDRTGTRREVGESKEEK